VFDTADRRTRMALANMMDFGPKLRISTSERESSGFQSVSRMNSLPFSIA